MAKIQIKYEEVYKKTAELKAYINNELLSFIETEYNSIQSQLDGVDSATNAQLKDSMELNKQKSMLAAQTLDKLLSFMSNSSTQVQMQEHKMASAVIDVTKAATSSIKKTTGGTK